MSAGGGPGDLLVWISAQKPTTLSAQMFRSTNFAAPAKLRESSVGQRLFGHPTGARAGCSHPDRDVEPDCFLDHFAGTRDPHAVSGGGNPIVH